MGEYDELYHHGIKGQKWGVIRKKHHPMTKAYKAYLEAKRREPRITKTVKSSVEKSGAEMYGLENRLKTVRSIARKQELDKEIRDAIRYTAILSDETFVDQYSNIKANMINNGYSETRCKNYFEEYRQGKVNHKSVQCNYETMDGYSFEIQFQTKASQRAKDKKVPLYEEARDPNTTEARQKQITKEMRKLAEEVPDPPGISAIEEHNDY